MLLRQIFDPYLAQYSYLVGCQQTGEAIVIDPEREIDRYQKLASENGLRITAATETHIHADFVSGVREFAQDPLTTIYLSGEGGEEWSYRWPGDRPNTKFLKDGDSFTVGKIRFETVHTPGHTPEHICFLITDIGAGAVEPLAMATGDFLFVGDVGRPDLLESAIGLKNVMAPSARVLSESLKSRLAKYQDFLQILPAHGAGSACGKSLGAVPTTTLGYERRYNGAFRLALSDTTAFVNEILRGQPEPPVYFATMKRVNRDGIRVTGGVPQVTRLTPSEFLARLSESNVKVLDTRDNREEFDRAHVRNAINAPLGTSFFSVSAGSYLSEDDRILLVVEDSADAELAVSQLYRIGFDHIIGWILFKDAIADDLLVDSIERISFSQFDATSALAEGAIIDVRSASEFESGHISGALSFPYTRLKNHTEELPRDRRLFVHCAAGKRSALAASFLRSEGFDVVHVDGSLSEYGKSHYSCFQA